MNVSVRVTQSMLMCGVVAPPTLLGVLLVDGATRAGYDQWRNGVSQLVTGDRGWLQQLSFVVCGLLVVAFAVGVRAAGTELAGSKWAARMIGLTGAGLAVAGVFATDPALGYPPGAAEQVTASGMLHQVAGTAMFAGLIGAAIAAGRRLTRLGVRGWARYSYVTAWLVGLSALAAGIVYRLIVKDVIGTGPAGALELLSFAAGFGWITMIAVRAIRAHS